MINENINNTFTKKDQHDLSVSKQKTRRSINNSILSTTKRSHSQSSKSKRALPKIAPPIDPKLYRVSTTSSTNNTIKKKKTKKRNRFLFKIPKSGGSMRDSLPQKKIEETINNISTLNHRKDIKFVSMRSFNIAKMSWSKENENTINNESKKTKKKIKNSKNKDDNDKPEYSHFSDIRKRIRKKTRFNTVSLNKKRKVNNSFLNWDNKLKSISENKNYVRSKLLLNQKINYNSNMINKKEGNGSKEKKMNESKKEINNLSVNNNANSLGTRNIKNLLSSEKEIMSSEKPPKKILINNNKNNNITNKKNTGTPQPPLVQNSSQQTPNKSRVVSLTKNNSNINNTSLPNIKNIPQKIPSPNIDKTLNNSFSFGSDKNSLPAIKKHPTQIQNVNNMSIQSVTLNNLKLTSDLKESLSNLIDNTVCAYCLKRVNQPITLKCKHEICLSCAVEKSSLYSFSHLGINFSQSLKCPKCKEKTVVQNNDFTPLIRKNWHPRDPNEYPEGAKEKIQYCEICPSSKFTRDIAEFECLNCDIVICYECRIRHLANPRHQDHKVIQYHKIIQEKVELTLCETNNHREPLKLYCETCKVPICVICANYENAHKGHSIKTVRNVLDEEAIKLSCAVREREGEIKIIKELIQHMTYSKEKIEKEKNEFFEKTNKIFGEIYDIIKKHEESLKNNINQIFSSKLEVLNNKLKNFSFIKNRYEHYRNLICERDIDIIDRVIQIKNLNKTIQKISNLNYLKSDSFNKSLANSILVNPPTKIILSAVSEFKFLPITDININVLSKIFAQSTIIKPEMLLNDFIIILPKIKSGILLYQISKDGASPITFHEKCDNKGPTITIVKTDTGHIFGGFNPISYISEAMYNECEDSFIFSLSNGTEIKPVKCPVKRYMKHHAIKQNDKMYSPGFGEIDSADLFISYKNLANSYSNLGKVYKAPKNCDPNKFLAGRPNKWNIVEVEVYAVEIISEEEYCKMVLA